MKDALFVGSLTLSLLGIGVVTGLSISACNATLQHDAITALKYADCIPMLEQIAAAKSDQERITASLALTNCVLPKIVQATPSCGKGDAGKD